MQVLQLLAVAASFALLIGGIELAAHGGMVALGVVIALAGLGSALALAWRERQQANPVFPVDLLAMPSIGLSTLAAIAAFVVHGARLLLFDRSLAERGR